MNETSEHVTQICARVIVSNETKLHNGAMSEMSTSSIKHSFSGIFKFEGTSNNDQRPPHPPKNLSGHLSLLKGENNKRKQNKGGTIVHRTKWAIQEV